MKESFEARAGRYLANEMTDSQKEAFELEINADPALKEQLSILRKVWDNVPSSDEQWDTRGAWDRFAASQQVSTAKFATKNSTLYWAIAATIIVVLGTFAIFFRNGSPVTYAYEEGAENIIELKDGSRIYLNKNSDITVFPFSRSKRHLVLHGEAYFDIAPDTKRPFTIASGKTITEVVGTSFNIRQTPVQTSIIVHSGKVIFSSKEDTRVALALTQGEAAVFENDRMEMIANPSPNIGAWRTGQLQFKNMPLVDVIRDLKEYYQAEISIENTDIDSCRITRTLPKQTDIKSVLDGIALTMNARISMQGEKYIIQGGSCN